MRILSLRCLLSPQLVSFFLSRFSVHVCKKKRRISPTDRVCTDIRIKWTIWWETNECPWINLSSFNRNNASHKSTSLMLPQLPLAIIAVWINEKTFDCRSWSNPLFCAILSDAGSNSPAQNSTRSISPNTVNISSSSQIFQPISPQTSLQPLTSPLTTHLLNNSLNLGNTTPTLNLQHQVELDAVVKLDIFYKILVKTFQLTSLSSSLKSSPSSSGGQLINVDMPMPGTAPTPVVAPGTPNSTTTTKVNIESLSNFTSCL